ncbi:hypothetical protein NB550_18855 [Vibrio parahaemolyticus]|uniref:hypothetical protein n=1 Tax=Vibrio parahaemolyticus TaxID=670 RepID=UPI001B82DD4A|nr:hypothetical protein [Vibrio parahaemolyticus]EKH9212309.1 hypothetical protein [Vibrio parahaemolyticus]ELB2131749.1 hypothetical protein [Vibrio parahaemolyticus]ELB2146661.1 hypothetical protein [Vibrio parahaemolyticus]ELB2239191.1 hypothetical protein [Vibrio parahaemolyticus]MCR9891350.1 hypothetical protein [Vibrio parahaemolyticus]
MPKQSHTSTESLYNLETRLLHAWGMASTLSSHNEFDEHLQFTFGAIADLLDDAYNELSSFRAESRKQQGVPVPVPALGQGEGEA